MTKDSRCPACGQVMDGFADRCPSCGIDPRAFRLLQARLDGFEQRLAALEIALGIGDRKVTLARHDPRKLNGHARIIEVVVLGGLPVAILFFVHYLLTVVSGEMNPRHMLIAAVVIPLPFGFLLAAGGLQRLTLWMLGSLGVAFSATLGMNLMSTLTHGSDLLPQSAGEAWEFATYAISIALSHAAGLILGLVFWQVVTRGEVSRNRARWQYRLARFLVGRQYDDEQGHRAAVELLRIARLLVAVAAIAGSAYSAWLRFRM